MARSGGRSQLGKSKYPWVMWNGWVWIKDHEGYYRCKQRGPMRYKRLHREVWTAANGPIPEDYEVNHIDHNKDNNDISNLEALPRPEHGRESKRFQHAQRRKAQALGDFFEEEAAKYRQEQGTEVLSPADPKQAGHTQEREEVS